MDQVRLMELCTKSVSDVLSLFRDNTVSDVLGPDNYRVYAPEVDHKSKNDHFQEMFTHAVEAAVGGAPAPQAANAIAKRVAIMVVK